MPLTRPRDIGSNFAYTLIRHPEHIDIRAAEVPEMFMLLIIKNAIVSPDKYKYLAFIINQCEHLVLLALFVVFIPPVGC